MNFSPKDTCVWNLPMSEPNNARSLALTSKGRGSAFPAVAFFTDIITIKKNRTSCSHLTKTG